VDVDDDDVFCAHCHAPLDIARQKRCASYCEACEAMIDKKLSTDGAAPIDVPSPAELLKLQQGFTTTDHIRSIRGTSGLD
jgi:hypothetical protein